MRRFLRRFEKFHADIESLDLERRLPPHLNEDVDVASLDPATIIFLIQIALMVLRFWRETKEED